MILLLGLALAGPVELPKPGWCTKPERLTARDEGWCAELPPDCPGLALACEKAKNKAVHQPPVAKHPKPEETRIPTRVKEESWTLPSFGLGESSLGAGFGWVILGVVLLLVLVGLLRRVAEPEVPVAPDGGGDANPSGDAPVVGVTLGGGWLAAAQRARDAGRYVEALLIARGAVVASFEEHGRLAPDPGRTDRELVYALDGDKDTQTGLRTLVFAIEWARYAGAPLAKEAVDLALRAAVKLTTVALLCLAFTPLAHAGPGSKELLPKLLEQQGAVVIQETEIAAEPSLQLWLVDDWASAEEVADVLRAVEAGAVVYAFGTGTLPHLDTVGFTDGGWAKGDQIYLDDVIIDEVRYAGPVLTLPGAGHRVNGGRRLGWFDEDDEPVAAVVDHGAGQLVIVANDWLLDDGSLLRPENAAAITALLAIGPGAKVTIVSRDSVPPSALHQLLEAGFGVAFFQLALLWLLWAAWKGRGFAPRQEFTESPPREFAMHLRAVGRFYRAAHSSRVGFAAVSARALHRLRKLTGAGDLTGNELADHLAIRLGHDPHLVRNLVARAEAALADPRGPPSDDEPWLTEAIWNLVKQPTR